MSEEITRREMTKACMLGLVGAAFAETGVLTNAVDVAAAATARPRKVTGVKVTKITATSAKVTWQKVPNVHHYEIRLTGSGNPYKFDHSSFKCSCNFDYLNPEKKCVVQVRAVRYTKKGNARNGKWSNKKTFKTKSALLRAYKLSGIIGSDVVYKLTKAEMRNEYRHDKDLMLAVFFTATNKTESDESIYGPRLNAYQNGIKLSDAYSALGLNDEDNGWGETVAPGYSIKGWVGFTLRDMKTPVVLRSVHHDYSENKDVIDFECTVKLA